MKMQGMSLPEPEHGSAVYDPFEQCSPCGTLPAQAGHRMVRNTGKTSDAKPQIDCRLMFRDSSGRCL